MNSYITLKVAKQDENVYLVTREDIGKSVTYEAESIYDLLDRQLFLIGYKRMIAQNFSKTDKLEWEVLIAIEDPKLGDVATLDKNPVRKLYTVFYPECKMQPDKLTDSQVVAFIELLLKSEGPSSFVKFTRSGFDHIKALYTQSYEGSIGVDDNIYNSMAKHILSCAHILDIEKVKAVLKLNEFKEQTIYDDAT